ncbi:regulatory LuxR family protein [Nocardioides sp. J9]|uniref:helix-turn-helix transcriptional regulator n=1 Tax=Nocardioides sp. J9 TaxID=935844 RepID=UPI0011A4CC14|nr:AAA family ATPase [Nocardioides sp. J9]TWG92933.1 regulatory LuxR family protein [Nocardioides sp. J9]
MGRSGDLVGLLERTTESAAIDALLGSAGDGAGGIVLLRGPAGVGKTALLQAAREAGRSRGMLVLSARGADFEQDFAFGTARQLFGRLVNSSDPETRARLLAGPAAPCRSLFSPDASREASGEESPAAVVEGIAWLVDHLSSAHPHGVLLAVDDIQSCDRASLRALARLALGLEDVGVVIALAHRLDSNDRNEDLISWLAADPRAKVVEPPPLSAGAVGQLVRSHLGSTSTELTAACRDITGGNPFLVGELLAALRSEGLPADAAGTIDRVRELVPDAVLRSVTARLSRLGKLAGRIAHAVAVLGPDALLDDVAALAGLPPGDAVAVVMTLVDEGLLADGETLAFRHQLLAAAVERDMTPVLRTQLHSDAATLLRSRGAPDERVAAHLLAVPPRGDAEVVAVLRRAAAAAMGAGGPDGAVPLLRRALLEVPGDDDPAVVLELARAEAAAGDPAARDRLQQALPLVSDPRERIQLMRDLTRLQFMNEHHAAAARVARQAWQLVPDDDPLSLDLLAEYIATGGYGSGTIDTAIRSETEELASRLAQKYFAGEMPPSPGLAVQVANMLAGMRGRRADVRRLIETAVSDGPLDAIPPFGLAPIWATLALVAVDCLDLAGDIATRARPAAEARRSIHALGTAAFSSAIVSLERGALEQAERECARAVELTQSAVPATFPWSAGILASARRLRGDLEGARRAIQLGERTDPDGYTFGIVVHHRSLLALAEGDDEQALADAYAARDRLAHYGIADYALMPWRLPAAAAAHRLGRQDEALELADQELALARRAGAPRSLAAALLCRASTDPGGPDELDLLEEAVAVAATSDALLARAQAAYHWGAGLHRAGATGRAVEELKDAHRLAVTCGADPLADQVRRALRSLGVRTRKAARSSRDGALSRSERRSAALAALGHSNREIAARLHLTISTVEYHLTHAYRKLDITSRAELPGALRSLGLLDEPEAAS